MKMSGTCDVCGGYFGQYANMKINGLIMCDGCCYDPNKAEMIESMARLKKGLLEEVERLRGEKIELLEALCGIQNACIGQIAMGYSIDAESMGFDISEATKMTNPELNAYIAKIKGNDNA